MSIVQYKQFLFLLVSNTKIRIFKFRDGFFIRKVCAVNARTRTSDLAQPGLHGIDFLFGALHLACYRACAGILHPANHSYFLSLTFCVHSEADTLHSPEHLVVHGFEGPCVRHGGGEPSAEELERGYGRGDCSGHEKKAAHGTAWRTPRLSTAGDGNAPGSRVGRRQMRLRDWGARAAGDARRSGRSAAGAPGLLSLPLPSSRS